MSIEADVLQNTRKLKSAESITDLEQSELYKLIIEALQESWIASLEVINTMSGTSLRQKSIRTGNTYLHELVLALPRLYSNNDKDIRIAIVLLYRLAFGGCDINAQNKSGNTCLHLACFRPMGELITEHFLRLGVDPCIENNMGYRVFVNLNSFSCYLIKGQPNVYCSIWQAVQKEDFKLIERFVHCWYRINTKRKRKSLLDVAYDTGNYETVNRLNRYQNTNELVAACFACHVDKVLEFVKMRFDKPDINTKDHSSYIHKPLLEAMKELSPLSDAIIEILVNANVKDTKFYYDELNSYMDAFSNCTFSQYVENLTEVSLLSAWQLIEDGQVPINVLSNEGDTLLHLIVYKEY